MADHTPRFDRRRLLKSGLGVATAATAASLGSGALLSGTAHATTEDPFGFIIDCDSWGARPPSSPLVMNHRTTRKIIIHHTAYPNSTDYSLEQAIWLARDIQNLHMDTNGWSDTGQHFTISRGGYVLEGRHRSLEGLISGTSQVTAAHCPGMNTQAIGIENEGTYITETPTPQLLDSLVRLCVTICRQYGLHAHNMFGHWDFRHTQCPGIAFYRLFPEWRRRVAVGLGPGFRDVPRRTWPDVYSSVSGPVVAVAQYLLRAQGYLHLPTTGIFTPETVEAVQDWQSRNGFEVSIDGTMTDPTWESLAPHLDRRSHGEAVSALQYILGLKGYAVSVTGEYDRATTRAVKELQRLHNLPPRGTVDTSTWCAVVGGIVHEEFRGVLR